MGVWKEVKEMDFVGIAAILFGIAEIIKASAKVIQSIEEQTQMRPMVRRCRQQLRATGPYEKFHHIT